MNLYELQPSSTATSSLSANPTPSPNAAQGSSQNSQPSPAVVAVLSSIGGFLVVCSLLLLFCILFKRHNRRKQVIEILREPPVTSVGSPPERTLTSIRDNNSVRNSVVSPLSPSGGIQVNHLAATCGNVITNNKSPIELPT